VKISFPFFLGMSYFIKKSGISRYLKGSIIGIGLSIIPLVVVLEVTDGMIQGITSRYLEIGTYHLEIFFNRDEDLEKLKEITGNINKIKGIRETIIERRGMGLIFAGGIRTAVTLRAIPKNLFARDAGYRKYVRITDGKPGFKTGSSILISKSIADELKLKVGGRVALVTVSGGLYAEGKPRFGFFTVTGIFTTGYQELDKMLVFIPLEKGMKFLNSANSYQIIGVKVDNPFGNLTGIARAMERYLPGGTAIYSWYELELSQYKSFQTTKALLLLIMALIVIVAGINISSSMIMIVIEKSREIAILKGIGAYPWMITGAFMLTGFVSGTAGTVLGLILGILISININELFVFAQNLINIVIAAVNYTIQPLAGHKVLSSFQIFNSAYYLDRIPIKLDFYEIFIIALGTIMLTTLASYFPAKKAGLLKPLELLRRY